VLFRSNKPFIHGDILRTARVKPAILNGNERFVKRVKPFSEMPEDEITLYAYLNNITFQSEQCPYAPYALRTEIRDFVNRLEARHPGSKFTIYRSFEKMRPLLKGASKTRLKQCRLCGEPSANAVCEACSMLLRLRNNYPVKEIDA